jgi:hypothetical protein
LENSEVRALRRALSSDLTRTINTATNYPEIRLKVLESLEELNERFTELESLAHHELHIVDSQPLIRFYMKGGNAYTCAYEPAGVPAQDQGGGNSDWDTQVIVNPWAPLPVQTYLYSRIEDIIRDQMIKTGVEIAPLASALGFPPSPTVLWAPDQQQRHCYYQLTRDDPQTFRQVFDYERLGMWMNGRMPLSDENVPSEFLSGIVFNDGIVPFQLFRMGYTWHAAVSRVPPYPPDPVYRQGPEIERPVLMELIDVTLPRRNTVEAVEVWRQIETGDLDVLHQKVGVLEGPARRLYVLPLPTLPYHLRENAIMLCEIADGSSHHKDKLPRRLDRFNQIWTSLVIPQPNMQAMLGRLAGTNNLAAVPLNPNVDATIVQYAPNYGPATPGYNLPGIQWARRLMYAVANRPVVFQPNRYLAGRHVLRLLVQVLGWSTYFSEAAYTDDVALRSTLADNGFINQSRLKSSDIYIAVVLRLIEHQDIDAVARNLEAQLLLLPQYRHDLLAAALGKDEDAVKELNELLNAKKLVVEQISHNTIRHSGISQERTFALFADGSAKACFTMTDAPPVEAPFRPKPGDLTIRHGSVVDMGEQRKAAAALIEDYAVRTALSEHFETLKRLFPGF